MSLAPVPATKVNELIKKLDALQRRESVDELALMRISHEAKALGNTDRRAMHVVLGAVAGMRADTAEVHRQYRAAMREPDQRARTAANYANALIQCGEMDEAFGIAMQAHEEYRDDPTALDNAIEIATHAARFTERVHLHERWDALCPSRPRPGKTGTMGVSAAIARRAFREEQLRRTIAIAHEVRVARRKCYEGIGIYTAWGEPDRFSIRIRVAASEEVAQKLSNEFLDRLMDDDELLQAGFEHFTLAITKPATDGDHS